MLLLIKESFKHFCSNTKNPGWEGWKNAGKEKSSAMMGNSCGLLRINLLLQATQISFAIVRVTPAIHIGSTPGGMGISSARQLCVQHKSSKPSFTQLPDQHSCVLFQVPAGPGSLPRVPCPSRDGITSCAPRSLPRHQALHKEPLAPTFRGQSLRPSLPVLSGPRSLTQSKLCAEVWVATRRRTHKPWPWGQVEKLDGYTFWQWKVRHPDSILELWPCYFCLGNFSGNET